VYERQQHAEFPVSRLFKRISCLCIFSETVCDKGNILKSFLRTHNLVNNIESNAKTLFTHVQ